LHEAVQGFAAAVVVAGLAGFGERLLPKGDGCFKAVGAEVGQLNVNLFPFVSVRAPESAVCRLSVAGDAECAVRAAQIVRNTAPERAFEIIGRITVSKRRLKNFAN